MSLSEKQLRKLQQTIEDIETVLTDFPVFTAEAGKISDYDILKKACQREQLTALIAIAKSIQRHANFDRWLEVELPRCLEGYRKDHVESVLAIELGEQGGPASIFFNRSSTKV